MRPFQAANPVSIGGRILGTEGFKKRDIESGGKVNAEN